MKIGFFGLLCVSLLPSLGSGQEESEKPVEMPAEVVKIFISNRGEVRFGSPGVEVWEDTGLYVTPEAMKYPKAVRQLVAERKNSWPVAEEVVRTRMVGPLTMEVTRRSSLELFQFGGTVGIRVSLAAEAITETAANPFGLLMGIAVALILVGNLLVILVKNPDSGASATFAAAFAFAFAFAATAFATAFAAAAFAAAFAAFAAAGELKAKWYRRFSAVAIACAMASIYSAL